jgi:hypothetical protein
MTRASAEVVKRALLAYPNLRMLLRLDGTGWVWLPPPTDEQGEVREIHGVRFWLDTGRDQVDALRVRSELDAAAVRTDSEGGILWKRDGGLVDVVEALIGLPPPDSPHAPRLVIGHAPRDQWWS